MRTGNGSMNIKMKMRQGDINISYKRIIRRGGSPPGPPAAAPALQSRAIRCTTQELLNESSS